MIGHISDAQLAAWLSGSRDPEVERHLASCPGCRAETRRMELALADFRESLRIWSARQQQTVRNEAPAGNVPALVPTRWRKLYWGGLALSTLAVSFLVVLPNRSSRDWLHLSAEDAALLETVQAELSRMAPQPMDPLAKLVLWDPASAVPGGDAVEPPAQKD